MSTAAPLAVAAALAVLLQLPAPAGQGAPDAARDTAFAGVIATAGAAPDTVTVGDHFRVLLRVVAPPGATVDFAHFNLVEPVESVDSLRVSRDSSGAWIASYRLVAWTTSDSLVGTFPFRVRSAEGSSADLRVRLRLPHVRSVLPADSSLHVPRPAKAVIPVPVTGPAPRGWLLPAVLLLLVLLAIVVLAVRRRAPSAAAPADPRSAALARLEEIERERLPQRGEIHEYHVRTSRVLREYLAARGGWGEDLTTTEVVRALADAPIDEALARELTRLLRAADRVKFSGGTERTDAREAEAFGAELKQWIVAWPAAAGSPTARARAA